MRLASIPAASALLASVLLAATAAAAETPRVRLATSMGDIVVALDPQHAPATVANFLAYVREGYYDGTVFHRVIEGFMIQGGGFTSDMRPKPAHAPIHNEADNGLANRRGTIAMARTSDPDSATSQFFINTVDNAYLDFKARTPRGWGYAVFGHVVAGMDVVDRIDALPTTSVGGFRDVPVKPVVIRSATVEPSAKKE